MIKRNIYILVLLVASLSFVFFMFSRSGDNPYMKVYPSGEGVGFAGCEFFSDKYDSGFYRLRMNPDECRAVRYKGTSSIVFFVDYPSFHVVREGQAGGGYPVYFYLEYVSPDGYDGQRHLSGKEPKVSQDGVETYEFAGFPERKFIGRDGASVYLMDFESTVRANRVYKGKFLVFYQYSRDFKDIKALDDFALGVLDKVVVE